MKENILIKFSNGRQCWRSSISPTAKKSLEIRFDSKIKSITGDSSTREYKTGQAWQQEHNRHNKSEGYEVPRSMRKKPVHNKFGTGGSTGSEIEYETVSAKGSANLHKKNTHFAIHKPTNSIAWAWDYKDEGHSEVMAHKRDYFFEDLKDTHSGNVDTYKQSDFIIVQRKNLAAKGIDLNDYLVFRGQKYGVGGVILPLVALYVGYKIGRFRPQKQSFETEGKIISKTAAAAKKAAQMAKTAADNRRTKKATMKTGGKTSGTKKKLSVWNWTDNISATASEFNTKAEANKFIKEFRARYEKQGYYKDNKWNKIAPSDIELEIYEVE